MPRHWQSDTCCHYSLCKFYEIVFGLCVTNAIIFPLLLFIAYCLLLFVIFIYSFFASTMYFASLICFHFSVVRAFPIFTYFCLCFARLQIVRRRRRRRRCAGRVSARRGINPYSNSFHIIFNTSYKITQLKTKRMSNDHVHV